MKLVLGAASCLAILIAAAGAQAAQRYAAPAARAASPAPRRRPAR